MKRFQRLLAAVLTVCFANATMIQTAQAGMISTEQVARTGAEQGTGHERLTAALARADVQTAMQQQGLDTAVAAERIAALTDEEASALADHIDSAPAGGIIGAILLVFFVLLVTDILGLTKVYPFTRSVR
ncbi:PA2779 family protein [Thauera phenolivorans]|uniref:PA2779 family protein n=1 Tax=Thauera phenolivorans TaxID=1792543 RepID=UPI00083AA3B1|nr:PA2779 family protein [Thauera phenolivorans]